MFRFPRPFICQVAHTVAEIGTKRAFSCNLLLTNLHNWEGNYNPLTFIASHESKKLRVRKADTKTALAYIDNQFALQSPTPLCCKRQGYTPIRIPDLLLSSPPLQGTAVFVLSSQTY